MPEEADVKVRSLVRLSQPLPMKPVGVATAGNSSEKSPFLFKSPSHHKTPTGGFRRERDMPLNFDLLHRERAKSIRDDDGKAVATSANKSQRLNPNSK